MRDTLQKTVNSYPGQYKYTIVRTHPKKRKRLHDPPTKSTQEKAICQEAKSYETITPPIER